MNRNVTFVVGDEFRDFSVNDGVITISELHRQIDAGELPQEDSVLVPGQGLSPEQAALVAVTPGAHRNAGAFAHWNLNRFAAKAQRDLTHKHKPENGLISEPRRVTRDLFEMDVLIDGRTELMSDHVTGQHVQGMVLVEACRQAFLAVTERFFINPDDGIKYYFVINEMNATYLGFVFPLDIQIRYFIKHKQADNPQRMSFDVLMEVMQGGQVATSVATKFTAFDAEKLKPKEAERAVKAIASTSEHFQPANDNLGASVAAAE